MILSVIIGFSLGFFISTLVFGLIYYMFTEDKIDDSNSILNAMFIIGVVTGVSVIISTSIYMIVT